MQLDPEKLHRSCRQQPCNRIATKFGNSLKKKVVALVALCNWQCNRVASCVVAHPFRGATVQLEVTGGTSNIAEVKTGHHLDITDRVCKPYNVNNLGEMKEIRADLISKLLEQTAYGASQRFPISRLDILRGPRPSVINDLGGPVKHLKFFDLGTALEPFCLCTKIRLPGVARG